jgi:hypothetical protein
MTSSRTLLHLLSTGALSIGLTPPVCAQLMIPQITMSGRSATTVPVSAAEAAYHLAVRQQRNHDAMSFMQKAYPKDSMRTMVVATATQWMTQLRAHPIRGIQLDPSGTVSVGARQDRDAEQQIATRLATPRLSVTDRAYTYLTAVLVFGDADIPARLSTAERYLKSLDSLGESAALQRFLAHRHLAGIYYLLGRAQDVTRHGLQAIPLVGAIEFPDRREMYWKPQFYTELVDAISGQPDAQARIGAMNAALKAATQVSAEMIALDSNFYWTGRDYRSMLDQMIVVGMRIGTRADDVQSNAWVNVAGPGKISGSHTRPMADGRIRILEIGHYSCPQCVTALGALQRIQDRYPGIQVVYATSTEGSWANRIIEPAVEVTRLTEYYTQKLNVTFPIAIWQAALKRTDDGGMLPEGEGPNFANYPMAGKPNIYIVDGKGRIRRVYIEAITREREAQIATVIEFLQKEAEQAVSSTRTAP